MPTHSDGFVREDPWRIFRIMAEFVDSFETMSQVGPAVTIFGSARTPPKDPYYEATVELGRRLAKEGLAVITGGGPGIMEAANRGAHDVGAKSIGLNIMLPFEQKPNPYIHPDLCFDFHYFAMRKMHFLMRARALVFPSLWYETLGLSAIEAMANGVPVIVSDRCAASEFVQNGYSGLHFQGGSVESLAQQLRRLRDGEVRALGIDPARARRYFLEHYGMTFQAYQRACRLGHP
jgi:uncharacterized protein (TIGR00725 family)